MRVDHETLGMIVYPAQVSTFVVNKLTHLDATFARLPVRLRTLLHCSRSVPRPDRSVATEDRETLAPQSIRYARLSAVGIEFVHATKFRI